MFNSQYDTCCLNLLKPVIYSPTNQALRGSSLFINHTNDPKVYIQPFYDHSWNKIHYFPWNDSFNYDHICNNVLKRITKNDTFYIISGSFNGGLGHKYLSVSISFHNLCYFVRTPIFTFDLNNDMIYSSFTRKLLERNQQLFSPITILWRI